MPVVTFEGGHLTDKQKKNLIHKLTDVCAETTGIKTQYFTILLREHNDVDMGFAGETVAEMKERSAKS